MELFQVLALFSVLLKVTWSHGGHHDAGKPLEFASEIHNKDHILEHLQNVVSTKPKDQLTDEELEFHYFKLHDYDNNNKLDGVEIGKALTHFHDGDAREGEVVSKSDEAIAAAVDAMMKSKDKDMDGVINYYEWRLSQSNE